MLISFVKFKLPRCPRDLEAISEQQYEKLKGYTDAQWNAYIHVILRKNRGMFFSDNKPRFQILLASAALFVVVLLGMQHEFGLFGAMGVLWAVLTLLPSFLSFSAYQLKYRSLLNEFKEKVLLTDSYEEFSRWYHSPPQ